MIVLYSPLLSLWLVLMGFWGFGVLGNIVNLEHTYNKIKLAARLFVAV